MRWKLIVIASLVAALAAFGLWCALAIGIFGSARVLAQSDARLLSSLLIPATLTALAGIFVYRHTSKQRKLQALITIFVALLFTAGVYLFASTILVAQLYIPTTYEVRHGR